MRKKEFLENAVVNGFISWLAKDLPQRRFHLNLKKSKFVPDSIQTTCDGINEVLKNYCWSSSWIDPISNEAIKAKDWNSTKESLNALGNSASNALNQNNAKAFYGYCLAILQWGGVRGAKEFLTQLNNQNELIAYFKKTQPEFSLNNEELNFEGIKRFDAGLTKIHSLLDETGSPIYDSRVGAAIALLFQLFIKEEKIITKSPLNFPVGIARGKQIRNPKDIISCTPPALYSNKEVNLNWVKHQKFLGWILEAVLNNSELFHQENNFRDRVHAFEASLFMVGYDLRCFGLPLKKQQ